MHDVESIVFIATWVLGLLLFFMVMFIPCVLLIDELLKESRETEKPHEPKL